MNQLERDTAAYFDNMTEEELKEENDSERRSLKRPKGLTLTMSPDRSR